MLPVSQLSDERGVWLRVYPGGREVIDTKHPRGRALYRERKEKMLARQGGICCLSRTCPTCPGRIRKIQEATFEHEAGRGGGKRDDRIEDEHGNPINGAAHWLCNAWKGSRRIAY